MIAYGICIGSEEKFQRFARPGLALCASPGAPIAESRDNKSIFTAYNEILDVFGSQPELEALVLMHEDVELRDPSFESNVRALLRDGDVAVAGAIGAVGVRKLAWWEGQGRGRCLESRGLIDFGGGVHAVDAVDGLLLVLSAWAVRNLRFDELLFHGFHGYDLDICFQARSAGRKVVTADFELMHHTKGGFGDEAAYQRADAVFQRKWFAGDALPQQPAA